MLKPYVWVKILIIEIKKALFLDYLLCKVYFAGCFCSIPQIFLQQECIHRLRLICDSKSLAFSALAFSNPIEFQRLLNNFYIDFYCWNIFTQSFPYISYLWFWNQTFSCLFNNQNSVYEFYNPHTAWIKQKFYFLQRLYPLAGLASVASKGYQPVNGTCSHASVNWKEQKRKERNRKKRRS